MLDVGGDLMAMTARETMQALLDGKTLRYNRHGMDVRYKLDDKGNLLHIYEGNQMVLNSWTLSDLEVYEEYPLTFEQALRAMLDGKIVKSDCYPLLKQRFHDGCFEYNEDDAEWMDSYFSFVEQKAKWKVVE